MGKRRDISETSPPHDIEAEQAVLGSILLDARAMDMINCHATRAIPNTVNRGEVVPGWPRAFHLERHQHIASAMWRLHGRGKPIDLLTVADELGGDLEAAGGRSYLSTLPQAVVSPENVWFHWEIVEEKWRLRGLITAAREAIAACASGQERMESVASDLVCQAQEWRGNPVNLSTLTLDSPEARQTITEWIRESREGRRMLPTPSDRLNEEIGGYAPDEITLMQGPMGLGKTTWGVASALKAAKWLEDVDPSGRIAYISVEDSKRKIFERITSHICCINQGVWRHQIRDFERRAMEHVRDKIIPALPIEIIRSPGPTTAQIEARINAISKGSTRLYLVILDYGQKIRTGDPRIDASDAQKMPRIMDWIRDYFCDQRGCAVLLLSQHEREDKKTAAQRERDRKSSAMPARWGVGFHEGCDVPMLLTRDSYFDNTAGLGADGRRPLIEPVMLTVKPKRGSVFVEFPMDWCGAFGRLADSGTLAAEIARDKEWWRGSDAIPPAPPMEDHTESKTGKMREEDDDGLPF